MICPKCGSEIPSSFRFCGICGAPLPLAEVPIAVGTEQGAASSFVRPPTGSFADTEPSLPPESMYAEETHAPESPDESPSEEGAAVSEPGISGPSFLGLSDNAGSGDGSYSYLLDDEPRRSHAGAILLVIVLVILGAVAWRNWSAIEGYVASLRKPPASVYPNAADHSDTGLTSDVKPPEHVPVPPDQQVAANQPSDTDQPQITVDEQKKQSAGDEKKGPASPPERAAETPPAAESSPSASSDDDSKQQEARSDASSAVEEKQPEPPSKPARARAVTEKQPAEKPAKEERGARMLLLGENYLYGRTVPRSCDQALIYLKVAANAGNPAARTHLGALYSTGECVARDRVAAYHWFSLASRAEPANPWLESNLNMLWRDMSPDERRRVGTER